MSRKRALSDAQVLTLRKWRAIPRGKRPRTLEGMAAFMGITHNLAYRAAYGYRAYAKVNP